MRNLMSRFLIVVWAITTMTSTTIAQDEPPPEITPEATPETLILEPAEGQEIDPPIEITLPDDWLFGNGTIGIRDLLGYQLIPYTVYTGPVTGGDGYIILLWGFETMGNAGNPLVAGDEYFGPYLDALRLLRLAVLEPECVIGTEPERDFEVGGIVATGANFAVERCPETADARGWFLGTFRDGLNFAFYMYVEPIDALPGPAAFEMQSILDTVSFNVPEFLESLPEVEVTPEVTPESAP